MPNPFLDLLNASQPAEGDPLVQQAGSRSTFQPSGPTGFFAQMAGPSTAERMQANTINETRRNAGIGHGQAERERAAIGEIITETSRLREANPDADASQIFQQVVRSKSFLKNILSVDAGKQLEIIQQVQAASTKQRGKPVLVGEGAALVDPETNTEVYKNAKDPKSSKLQEATDTEIAKKSVANLDAVVDAGETARMDKFALDRFKTLGDKFQTGAGAAIKGHLARFGIKLDGASDIEAFESLVDRLTPTQRQGLPGAASDRDVAMFKSALPSLIRTPDGNKTIISTLQAMAEDRIKRAEIAESVFTGDRTVPDAIKAMRKLPNPMAQFSENAPKGEAEPTSGEMKPGAIKAGRGGIQYRFKGGNPRDRANWEQVQ